MIKNLIKCNPKNIINKQKFFNNLQKKEFIAQDIIRSPEKYLLSSPISFDQEAELQIKKETGLIVNENKTSYPSLKSTKKLEEFSLSKNDYLNFMRDNPNGRFEELFF